MAVVLDPCALLEANMDEVNGKSSSVGRIIDNEQCYMTPINVAEAYISLRDDLSSELAEAVLDMILENVTIKVVEDRDARLIRMVTEAKGFGVPYTVAFCAALARYLDCSVLSNESDFAELEKAGFCRVRHY
jgi:predicted nucleic acid-binding protein